MRVYSKQYYINIYPESLEKILNKFICQWHRTWNGWFSFQLYGLL